MPEKRLTEISSFVSDIGVNVCTPSKYDASDVCGLGVSCMWVIVGVIADDIGVLFASGGVAEDVTGRDRIVP